MSSILSKKNSVYTLGMESLKKTANWAVDTKGFPDDLICPVDKSTPCLSTREYLAYCVYDKNHRVSNDKYSVHLNKCRRNYLIALERKGCPAEIAKCAVNPEHWGYAPELAFHEYSCPDKFYLELETIYLKNPVRWEEAHCYIQAKARSLADAEMDEIEKELGKYDEVNESEYKHFPELYDYFIQLIKERPTPFQMQGQRYKMLKINDKLDNIVPVQNQEEPKERPKELFDQTKDPDAFGYIRRPLRYHRRSKYPKVRMSSIKEEADNDDQMWDIKENHGQPGYSWLEMQFHLNPVLRRCPPGLTRAERKEWEKQGTERLMCEKGIFAQDELEAALQLQKHNEMEKLELEWNKMN